MLITLLRKIGQGSHSIVYEARDHKNQLVAVKSVPLKSYGSSIIMETMIMSSFSCPYLQNANYITTLDNTIYLISDLATADLQSWLRKNPITVKQATQWVQSLALAINVLHEAKIIHADIKASNILLYPDGKIKLADFTLSCWTWTQTRGRDACTVTHRPLEVWCHQRWDQAVDIWAFGCTIYEICTNSLLFPPQGKNSDAYINAIIDWSNQSFNGKSSKLLSQTYELEKVPCEYKTLIMSHLFTRKEYGDLKTLLYQCLNVDPSNRITIGKVLQFFSLSEKCPPKQINPQVKLPSIAWNEYMIPEPDIKRIAQKLLSQMVQYMSITDTEIHVAITLAMKMCGLPLDLDVLIKDYPMHEARILKLLNYQTYLEY